MNKDKGIKCYDDLPEYKHHHIPMWLKKLIRKRAIEVNDWRKGCDDYESFLHRQYSGLFDHWGSIRNNLGDRDLISMPYCADYKRAAKFALEVGVELAQLSESPYGHGTHAFIFRRW